MAARPGLSVPGARRSHARGQAFVELAFVLLLFLALALLVVAGGWLAANWFAVGQAAREGARAGSRAAATDAAILEAVNGSASTFTGRFTSVSADTAPTDCAEAHAVCVCRHHVNATRCSATATPGDQIDVTVRHRVAFLPFAGGVVGQNAAVQLAATAAARVE